MSGFSVAAKRYVRMLLMTASFWPTFCARLSFSSSWRLRITPRLYTCCTFISWCFFRPSLWAPLQFTGRAPGQQTSAGPSVLRRHTGSGAVGKNSEGTELSLRDPSATPTHRTPQAAPQYGEDRWLKMSASTKTMDGGSIREGEAVRERSSGSFTENVCSCVCACVFVN